MPFDKNHFAIATTYLLIGWRDAQVKPCSRNLTFLSCKSEIHRMRGITETGGQTGILAFSSAGARAAFHEHGSPMSPCLAEHTNRTTREKVEKLKTISGYYYSISASIKYPHRKHVVETRRLKR
jgi:hypothetical protein